MNGQVNRSFSPFQESDESRINDDYWLRLPSRSGLFWSDLLKKRLVVILGEAGIGKTFEFQNEAKTLTCENQAAFFLPLNQLGAPGGFDQAIIEERDRYESWLKSEQTGHFFLDAVDEARLDSPIAIQNALINTRETLAPHLNRVSFYISSRFTDWSVPGVRDAVLQHLLKPLVSANTADLDIEKSPMEAVRIRKLEATAAIDLEVFTLDPLSSADAKKLAERFGVKSVESFWREVEEGGYDFLATRPLDLQWLSALWKQSQTLGTYSELLEAAVTNRLTEFNQSYVLSKAVLSRAQLREGAEQLAAACILSGCTYIRAIEGEPVFGTVAAGDALPHWNPLEHLRLLGTAVFDGATYGRFKFHHRAVREYLAACWLEKQMAAGLPVSHMLRLFVQAPYGYPVLLNSRRPVLCWLAALNANVRQRVIRQFPELLMFEGDPQRWSTDDVVEAFDGYFKKRETGYRPNWWNDVSEVRRVARMIPQQLMAEYLSRYANKPEILGDLLPLVKHGRMEACRDILFSIYRDCTFSERERLYALVVLSAIAAPAHKAAIAEDLVSGKLQNDELMAAALGVVGIEKLDVGQLTKIFLATGPEKEFETGPMATTLQYNMLPELSFEATLKLLSSLLSALPTIDMEEMIRRTDNGKLREGWILKVLPDVLLRALELIEDLGEGTPSVLVDASLIVEKLRFTTYADNKGSRQLRIEIEKRPEFRQHLALTIALSKDIPHAVSSLTGMSGLINFSGRDLDWLVREAMREDLDPLKRQVWYEVARDIAIVNLHGVHRRQVLGSLREGVDATQRSSDITAQRNQWIGRLTKKRAWERQDRSRKEEKRQRLVGSKAELLKQLEGIRSGASFNAIVWLVQYSAEGGSRSEYTKVDTKPIYRGFGQELGDAFDEGLSKVWRQIDIPNPANYLDNRLPWTGLVGLASVNHAFAKGLEIKKLTPADVTRVAQLSVWKYGKPEPWFDQLFEVHGEKVTAALMPWIEFELGLADEAPILNTLNLALRGPIAFKKVFLEKALVLLREGKISRKKLQEELYGEIIDSGLASKELIQDLALSHLSGSLKAIPPVFASKWFVNWASIDFAAAWHWIEENSKALTYEPAQAVTMVAEALEESSWTKGLSGTVDETRALVALFRFLNASMPKAAGDSADELVQGSSLRKVRDRIPGILASLQGGSAQEALQELAAENAATPMGDWILGQAHEHASAEAERRGLIPSSQIAVFGEVYTRDPRTEGELFDQVMARLEEIRECLEGGPFSDRVLFAPEMAEKQLQIWLAARLDDTPRRRFIPRFAVTREPQVDDEKRTDLEVSCAAGKVCIEIKPLDSSRSYSANSLRDTLKDQLVGQYLKGRNSRHGVLVMVRLDKKRWQIPGLMHDGEFEDLLEYLRAQAVQIKTQNDKVERLEVFGINCARN
jgi:hypothetical protein